MVKLLSTKELSKLLNVDRKTIYKFVKNGDLPYIKITKGYKFHPSDVAELIQNKKVKKNKIGNAD